MNISVLITGLMMLVMIAAEAQQVPNFSLTNVTNGKPVSLDTYPSCAGVAIVFTSNACAYDGYYRERIKKLTKDYQDRVPVLLVNSSTDPLESTDNMTQKAQQLGLRIGRAHV